MKDAFSGCNPIVNFVYFGMVISVTIFFLHPVLLGISFISGMAYSIFLNGRKALKFNLGFLLPLMLVAAVFNPLFNHEGMTILFYFNDNPITLESVLYGVSAAVMIGAVMLWFSCYNAIMTSDKFLYLFGKIIPSLSLVFSMALRFIPRYKAQIKRITNAQRGIGRDVSSGNILKRIRSGLSILSIMITWALENGVETADSMHARGYGLPGRSAYSNYGFDTRDSSVIGILIVLFAVVVASIGKHIISIVYFPAFAINASGILEYSLYAGFAVICLLPLLMGLREQVLWKYSRLAIPKIQMEYYIK
jgi:energy-coupling factor transport system permease protein